MNTEAQRLIEELKGLEFPVNTQLYQNSELCGSIIEQDYKESEDRLYNDKEPNLAIKSEKPEHRAAIFLKAQGLSNNEIARRLGVTPPWVSQILRQPWARKRIVEELRQAGRDAVTELIKASAEDSVFTLIEQRDNQKAKPAERISAANALLDRFLGKPIQHVETTQTNLSLTDLQTIEQELQAVEAEEKRLTGIGRN